MFWKKRFSHWSVMMMIGILVVWGHTACDSAEPSEYDSGMPQEEMFGPGANTGSEDGSVAGDMGGSNAGTSGSQSGNGVSTAGGSPNTGGGIAPISGSGSEELPDINCEGLVFTDEEVCLKKANGVLPMKCKGLPEDEFNRCCSRVFIGLPDKAMAIKYFPECTSASSAGNEASGICTEEDNALLAASADGTQPVMNCYIGQALNMADIADGCEAQHRIGAVLDWCMRDCLTTQFPTITPACADCFGQAQQSRWSGVHVQLRNTGCS